MFYDGEPQPGAAGQFGMAFIHSIEALKHPMLVLKGDADACVGHLQHTAGLGLGNRHVHLAAVNVVLNRVSNKIVNDLVKKPGNPLQQAFVRRYVDSYIIFVGGVTG